MTGLGNDAENTVGLQFQTDNIFNGLLSTRQRRTLSTTRRDHVVETSLALYAENSTRWTPWFRTLAGCARRRLPLQGELRQRRLANRKASAIDCFYTSRLPGEAAAGVADVHFHPVESRSLRLSRVVKF